MSEQFLVTIHFRNSRIVLEKKKIMNNDKVYHIPLFKICDMKSFAGAAK